MLAMNDLAVLPTPHRFEFTGLHNSLFSFFTRLNHLVHSSMSRPFIIYFSKVLRLSRLENQFELLFALCSLSLQTVQITFFMMLNIVNT